jgi:hypothetical protein
MRSDIEAYVCQVVAVREPVLDLVAIRQRAACLGSDRSRRSSDPVFAAMVAIVVLAFVLVGQVAAPVQSVTSVRTPAPVPAQT